MAESPKRRTDVFQADAARSQAGASRESKPIRPPDSPSGETARAADSVPAPFGPFATLPIQFGRYEIRKELGRGQMGAVYLAHDVELDRLVALKVARVSVSGSANLLKRMEIEAKSAAKVDHPHICKVYDAGVIDGIRFIALQYIEGENLKQYLKRLGRKRDPKEAVRLILQILQALEAAHDQGVIHRDLKPENIMLNLQNEPVIMDFGLARKTIASSDAGLTQGMIVGTAAYMSPEQATGRAESIDHRSDLYAVGVMLFEMLTGEWPFTGGAIEVIGKKCLQEPPSPLTLNPALNPRLAVVCEKMIAKQKVDRYVTCAEVIEALQQADLNPDENRRVAKSPADSGNAIDSGRRNPPKQQNTGFNQLHQNRGGLANVTGSKPTGSADVPGGLLSKVDVGANAKTESKPDTPSKVARSFSLDRARKWWESHPMVPFWASLVCAGALVLGFAAVVLFPKSYGIVPIAAVDGAPAKAMSVASDQPNAGTIEAKSEITSKTTGMRLKLIPAGIFEMGSHESELQRSVWEGPVNIVEITRPFYIGIYEVTQDEYQRVMGVNPSWFAQTGGGRDRVHDLVTSRFPAERVRWYDAIDFCNRLSVMDGYSPYYTLTNVERNGEFIQSADVEPGEGNGYRLPTEAEWEYACRGNAGTPFHFGEVLNGNQANVNGDLPYGTELAGRNLHRTTTVGSYEPNGFGLYDTHGNVNEWCFDVANFVVYRSRTGVSKDPVVLGNARENHMIRGGAWSTAPVYSRSAHRGCNTPTNVIDCDGFRVVLGAGSERSTVK